MTPARTAPATDATITRFMGKRPTVNRPGWSVTPAAGSILYTAAPGRLHRCMMLAAAIASRRACEDVVAGAPHDHAEVCSQDRRHCRNRIPLAYIDVRDHVRQRR